jgi:regulator of protease activity HflC (stomatin/prohibitin superfamily)
MMKNKSLLFVLVASVFMSSCTVVSVDPGEEAVLVEKPWLFGEGGVSKEVIGTGRQYVAISTDYKVFKIVPITYTEEFKDMIPSDNTPVSFNAYIKLQIRSGNSPTIYSKFGDDWYNNSVKEAFRTMVRIKASQYRMFELASDRKVSDSIQIYLSKELTTYIDKIGIPVNVLQVVIGAITPPDQVLTETKNTAAQNQSILTQQARASAELARKQAEINKAIADRAYQEEMRMDIKDYLTLRSLEIQKEKVELIKDHPNVTVILNDGSGVAPTFNVK